MTQLLCRNVDGDADIFKSMRLEFAGVPTGFPDHPVAQRLDQAGFFGNADKA